MKTLLILILSFSIITITTITIAQTSDCDYSGTPITVGTSCTTSNFNSNNNTDYWNSAAGCSASDNDDAWWWFTATATTTTITYNSLSDAIMHVFTGACATNMTAITCANATLLGDETINLATTIGTNYAIRIQRNASDNNMTGTICVYSPPSTSDLICDAVSVTCGNNYTGTTVGSTNTGETTLPGCGTSPSAPGVWYVFNGDGSTVTASLCTGTSFDSKINVYSGTACNALSSCVASNDDGCGTQSTVTFTTVVGTKYYILVNGYSGATGAYQLGITCCTPGIPACATLNSPANGATNIANCTSLTWTAPATSGCTSVDSYDVYFGTTNPPPFYANTTSTSYPITGAPSTTYYWQIRPKNSSGSAAGCTIRSFSTSSTGNPQYTMVDDATSPSPYDCVNLTTTSNDQRGCAWDLNSTLNFASNFTFDFTVNLGSSDAGADGMAFVMQNDPLGRCKCGTTGGALGAGGISNSVVVEIDTYLNSEDRDDGMTGVLCSGGAEPDHLDIWLNGNVNPAGGGCPTPAGSRVVPSAVPLTSGGSNYNIENGSNHILRISWNAATSTLTASVLNTALSTTYGTISYSFNPLTVFGTNNPYFGFTASTGGLNNNQSFCNPGILLPVELVSFHSYCYKNERKVYWSTASENNNAYFTLEKSVDGIHFTTVKIEAGNSQKNDIMREYEFIDTDIDNPEVYYRLSQTDINGNTKTYDIISSICKSFESEMNIQKLYKNGNQVAIQINLTDKSNHELSIVDLTGKIVAHQQLDPIKGKQTIILENTKLSTGFYLVQLRNNQTSIADKFWME